MHNMAHGGEGLAGVSAVNVRKSGQLLSPCLHTHGVTP